MTIGQSSVVELRQYTLHPGQRSTLVDVFEQHFVESQESAGITLGGVFLDEDDPDRFVWFRGFPDLEARRRSLESFYYGPVWAAHRDVANATMIDSDDVLLLRPTEPARPPAPANGADPRQRVLVGVHVVGADHAVEPWLTTEVRELLERQLESAVAMWRSEPGENSFPALPVRRDHAVVWSASFDDAEAREQASNRLRASPEWSQAESRLAAETTTQWLRLQPTSRSRHPAPSPATAHRDRSLP